MSRYIPTNKSGNSGNKVSVGTSCYVPEHLFINETGDRMRGPLDMNSNPLQNIPFPKYSTDAVNQYYVDREIQKIKSNFDKEIQNLYQYNDNTKIFKYKLNVGATSISNYAIKTFKISEIQLSTQQLKNSNNIVLSAIPLTDNINADKRFTNVDMFAININSYSIDNNGLNIKIGIRRLDKSTGWTINLEILLLVVLQKTEFIEIK